MAIVVFALGQFDVTADVLTGFVVVHVSVTLQLLAPAAIVHVGAAGVSVPVIGPRHTLPFQVVPDAQLADALLVASNCALLYRKNDRLL